jgi:hypothetical protein
MPELLIALAIIAVLVGLVLFMTLDAKYLAAAMRFGGVGALVLLGLLLAAQGLAVLDIPLGAVILILLQGWSLRGFAGAHRVRDWALGRGRGADIATIETGWVRMRLDRATGGLDGEVLSGQFRGNWLHQLDDQQLRLLLAECRRDRKSVRLVGTYLEQRLASATPRAERESDSRMTRGEALQILGLGPDAAEAEIREAHRRLIGQLHPDKGGSNYLASKINSARDLLVGGQ